MILCVCPVRYLYMKGIAMKSNIIAALSTFTLSVSASGFSMTEGRLEDE